MSFILLGILNSQAAGAGPYPAFLDSAPLWLDASDASTITESSGSVSQWDNKGTGENLVQATSASQPTTGVSTVNGLNVLDFAADYFETSDKTQWKFLHDGTKYFIAMVIEMTGNVGNNYWMTSNDGSKINIGMYLTNNDNDDNRNYQFGVTSDDESFSVKIEDNTFIPSDEIFVYSSMIDPTNATAADRHDYYKNQTAGSVSNTDTGEVSTSNSTLNFTFGAQSTGGSASTGQVGELIIVSGADATEENRQLVVDYLNAKWGVF